MSTDDQFGPVILFGQGGTSVEVTKDKALSLPPVNLGAVALTLIRISRMIVDFPQIREIDINPLLADPDGVIALDARVRVAATDVTGEDRLAIRPYPVELEEIIEREGDTPLLLLRLIVQEDKPALQTAFARLTPEESRLYFAGLRKSLPHIDAARFTQIDYDREMALVLTETGAPGRTDIFGVVRIHADPDNEKAEYAIILGEAMSGNGYGTLLMDRIIDYARDQGTGSIFGYVLSENSRMLDLCAELGSERAPIPEDASVTKVTLNLREA
jgi:acetyltransferase